MPSVTNHEFCARTATRTCEGPRIGPGFSSARGGRAERASWYQHRIVVNERGGYIP
jgi:hypothetical protein